MKPEDLVPNRETCERMKKLGWKAETFFVWARLRTGVYVVPRVNGGQQVSPPAWVCVAPTAAEIMEKLPYPATRVSVGIPGKRYVASATVGQTLFAGGGPTPAQALAELWIKVKEGKDADSAADTRTDS